jgi:hypothetical protein
MRGGARTSAERQSQLGAPIIPCRILMTLNNWFDTTIFENTALSGAECSSISMMGKLHGVNQSIIISFGTPIADLTVKNSL